MSDGKLFDIFAQCLDNLWNLLRSDKPESKFYWTSQLGWNRDSAGKQRRKSQVSDLIWKYGAWSYQNIRQNIYNKLLDISRIEKLYIQIFWINGIIREKLRYFITYLRISNLSFINRWDRRRQKFKKKNLFQSIICLNVQRKDPSRWRQTTIHRILYVSLVCWILNSKILIGSCKYQMSKQRTGKLDAPPS